MAQQQLNPVDLLDNLTQNDIDFLCKNFQVWHDFFFGEGNDDTSLEQIEPFTMSCMCSLKIDNRAYGYESPFINGVRQYNTYAVFSATFDGYNMTYGSLTPVYADAILNQTTEEGQLALGEYLGNCSSACSQVTLQCERKGIETCVYANDRCVVGFPNYRLQPVLMPCSYANTANPRYYKSSGQSAYFQLFNNQLIYGANSTTIATRLCDTVAIDTYSIPSYVDNNATPSSGYYKNWGLGDLDTGVDCFKLKPYKGYGAMVTNQPAPTNTDFWNTYSNDSTTYNNTYNYTTNNGDNITTYYGDDYIFLGTQGTPITYIDLTNILNNVINDLNINGNITGSDGQPLVLDVPTWDELRYIDQGDFNITPIEQLRPLPVSPSFDVDLDVGALPDTIGYSVTEYLDIADAVLGVGGSALLLGALFFSFLWMKIKRR